MTQFSAVFMATLVAAELALPAIAYGQQTPATPPDVVMVESSAASGGATQQGPEARLRLVAPQVDVRFYRRTGHAEAFAAAASAEGNSYADLCGAPCEVVLPAGRYTFALSEGTGSAVEARPIGIPVGRSTIEGRYISRSAGAHRSMETFRPTF